MKNILVTGGAGYIGSHCCKELFKCGFQPITIDNFVYGHKKNIKWGPCIEGNIGDVNILESCFDKYNISAVIHFAAYAYVGESVTHPSKYYENNVQETISLLNFMVKSNIKNFIFSSSCATYGNPITVPMDETHPQNPINPYGKTKYMIEEILKDYDRAYGLKFCSLRYFNAAGADPDCELGENHNPETHLIPLILDVALGKRSSINILGTDYDTEDGTCIRDYIHVTDLSIAHILALKKLLNNAGSDFYNLGTGVGNSVLQIIDKTRTITGQKITAVSAAPRDGDPPILVASNSKAMSELGWQPKYSNIDDIIATAWEWHKKLS